MKTLLQFVAGELLFGASALAIGYAVWPEDVLLQGGVAFALAFVPAVLTLAGVVCSYRGAPEMQLLAALGGSGIRMMVALGGGFLLTNARPQIFNQPFWTWLVLFYLTLLGFEIALLIRQQPKLNGSPQA